MIGQGRRERRRGERRIRRFTRRTWMMIGAVGIGFVALLGVLIVFTGDGEGRYPRVGDHWHAQYSIVVCGETEPPFPVSEGGVHTHGGGLIHLHPTRSGEAGVNANLARFMAGTGSRLTNTSLKLPSGEEYANGDPCPNGEIGNMFLRVNGIGMREIASYVPSDGDTIELGFEAQ